LSLEIRHSFFLYLHHPNVSFRLYDWCIQLLPRLQISTPGVEWADDLMNGLNVYEFKLKPTKKIAQQFESALDLWRELYNAAFNITARTVSFDEERDCLLC